CFERNSGADEPESCCNRRPDRFGSIGIGHVRRRTADSGGERSRDSSGARQTAQKQRDSFCRTSAMKPFSAITAMVGLSVLLPARGGVPEITLSSRIVDESMRSVLVEVREYSGQELDELRIELPRNSAQTAILSMAPKDWKLERDGHSIRVSGPAVRVPLRL